MKKTLIITGLILFILLSFGFVVIKSQSLGADTDYFNRHLRARFDRYPLLREVFGLHYDGDGRFDYLGGRYSKVTIEVDEVSGQAIDIQTLQAVAKKIQDVTDKPVSYYYSTSNITTTRDVTDVQINKIAKKYHSLYSHDGTAAVYLLVADQKQNEPKLLGATFQEYGIVIFNQALKDFTKDSPVTFDNYQMSTILHEMGHQLGLPHNDKNGCLMNEHAEQDHIAKFDLKSIITDFCPYEKDIISVQAKP